MKKNNFTLIIFLILGLLAGTIVGEMLSSVEGIAFITKSLNLLWEPSADLNIIKYDLRFQLKVNLVSILGALGAYWLFRKI